MDHGTTKRFGIPISHLDYRFIETCTDVKHLQKILHILRSGEEGKYPDLTAFCERQIEKHAPRSRALRKDKPPATAADFSWEEWRDIDSDFKVKVLLFLFFHFFFSPFRFDVDKEISKIEESSEEKVQSKPVLNPSISELKKTVDTAGLSQVQISFTANREKEKGNEAFRSGDYEEAVSYYTRSISILPTVAAYNNRAQAEIKLKNWQNALNDCERVLALEAGNVKALIRRATVHKNLRNYQAAVSDLKTALLREPGNPTAKVCLCINNIKNPTRETPRPPPRPSKDKGAHNGLVSNGQEEKRDPERQSRGQDPNHNTEPSLPRLSPTARLKAEGNQLFKNGQFGEAAATYSQAISQLQGSENAEELGILYSNRAACQLKEGNSRECIEDCNRALELQPYSMKPLLRRAMANESLERYRDAYVDYKIALQIDRNTQVANDSINRITRTLIDQDGTKWREKLPPIPSVPVSFHLQRHEDNSVQPEGESDQEMFQDLKSEGNEHLTNARYKEAAEKYRVALCYLKLCQYEEARRDCESALQRDASNIKALYRRAQANKGLEDLHETLAQDPGNLSVLALVAEITPYLNSSSQEKLRKKIDIEEVCFVLNSPLDPVDMSRACPAEAMAPGPLMTKPSNTYEFGQRINEVKATKDTEACAELLAAIDPKDLPVFLSNTLEGDTLLMIVQSLKCGVLLHNPTLVYQHLSHLTTAERFQVHVALMFLDQEKAEIHSLFTSLSENPPEGVESGDILDLVKEYGL
uniref:Sperm associated antigen 1 n=1 Tax=Leptobrachium leishanense TaxID=445787 RepID=A0A8C5Q280_9ANUR